MAATAFIIVCFEALLLSQAVRGQSLGNCTTSCPKTACSASQVCCWCTKFTYGPYQSCGCCPSGTTCCSSGSPSSVACCPKGSTCSSSGQCIRATPATAPTAPADLSCTLCDASATVNLTLSSAAGTNYTLYVDGVPASASAFQNTTDAASSTAQAVARISATACLVAVQVQAAGSTPGFMAQLAAYGLVSDGSWKWKCASNGSSVPVPVPSDWFSTTTNDTQWSSDAVAVPSSIWSSASDDPVAYCRATLPTCDTAGNQCGVSIPGCVNPCLGKAGKTCCGSQLVPQGPQLLTTCCAKGFVCAGVTSLAGQQLCCPAGSVYNNATALCVITTIAPQPITKLCAACK